MKRSVILFLVLIAAAMGAQRTYSQVQDLDKDPWVCGDVRVDCPEAGGPVVTFTAKVNQGVPVANLTFNWKVSRGKIISGQRTDSITVDTRGLEGKSFAATVEVGGFPKGCGNKAQCSTRVSSRRNRKPRR